MEQLPDLALIELFNSLPVTDQLKIRGVCKRWKAIIESSLSGRKELMLFYRTGTRPLVWFHSDHSVNLLGSLNVNEMFKKSPLFERLFKCIKRLYLICRVKELLKSNFINFANRFRHLEHLQVDTLADPSVTRLYPMKLKIRFNLPNLKSFCYNTKEGQTKFLLLDCPKLEKLSVPYDFRLDEKCASFKDSLKFLRVASFQCEPGFELPIYFGGIRFTLGPPEMSPSGGWRRCLRKSDLNMLSQNGEDLQLGHQHWELWYTSEFDGEIAALDAEQAEKLARCLTKVTLDATLSTELALNGKFKILFSFVQKLWMSKDIGTQSDLDRLPDLFPHLVELDQNRPYGIYSALRNPNAYPEEFSEGTLNFRFLARFKALHKLNSQDWRISPSELNEIVKSCPFLEEIEVHSTKLEELADGQIRTTIITIWIGFFGNQFRTGAGEYEFSVNDGKKVREERTLLETFHSSEAMADCLDQMGYLRKGSR